jgi:hypothetical protein
MTRRRCDERALNNHSGKPTMGVHNFLIVRFKISASVLVSSLRDFLFSSDRLATSVTSLAGLVFGCAVFFTCRDKTLVEKNVA